MSFKSFLLGFSLALCLSLATMWGWGCGGDEYDMEKYNQYRNNGELSDVVHEWMHAYIEEYCRVSGDGSIECE
jgi:hypothetical protein